MLESLTVYAKKVTKIFKDSSNFRVTTELGTDVSFTRERRRVIPSTGVLNTIGASGNLPSGEVFFAPIEKSFDVIFTDQFINVREFVECREFNVVRRSKSNA